MAIYLCRKRWQPLPIYVSIDGYLPTYLPTYVLTYLPYLPTYLFTYLYKKNMATTIHLCKWSSHLII